MKRRMFIFLMILVFSLPFCACNEPQIKESEMEQSNNDSEKTESDTGTNNNNNMQSNIIKLKIGNKVFNATLVDNSSTKALKELLSEGDVTINMSDYANMEKVGSLPKSLPRNDENISTDFGDLILYQGIYFVVYYGRNNYSLTRLGKINNVSQDELKQALGNGNVSITLSIK